ncbi:conserved hypothetical protein [Leishmania mexicana MHOM/GT/2001/U1103]|uniref:Uncharacterized protein n=1 Tax=Leishmania mexicana (strain MHOM/GT/2001/U1103) TaxID=929439 RepID=E9AXS1_LEIMU|nr:conserved hypothetical protein [Leishmania mexicana MHOM/GT/2001/U1103]CBZ27763.1 conserved hypothetical protein [Leishmania mexicana MHOM/GT/2001/U1103]
MMRSLFVEKCTPQLYAQGVPHRRTTARMSSRVRDSPQATTCAAATPEHPAVELQPALRQRTITFCFHGPSSVSSTGAAAAAAEVTNDGIDEGIRVVLHLSVRCFVDYVLLFVTEEQTCAPGVLLRYDAPAIGPAAFMYDDETPSLDFAVLLGLRDHPLTNLLASAIAHRIRRYGETRPLLMGLSVVQTAKKLNSSHAKKLFLDYAASNLLELAGEVQSPSK